MGTRWVILDLSGTVISVLCESDNSVAVLEVVVDLFLTGFPPQIKWGMEVSYSSITAQV